jgi:3-phosphoshikimate 1-carboxyvinyltransferase
MRLLAGLAAHHEFPSVFDGDASLRRRPMDRLVRPLEALGARVQTTEGHPPVRVEGGKLHGAQIETGIASAQVKSSALLAALSARGPTSVTEPAASRDHTERMLSAMGASVREEHLDDGSHRVEITPFDAIRFDLDVPGDPSSAAFLVAAAVLCGRVRIEGVDLNPTRVGFLDVLARMGAHVRYEATEHRMGEPVGWIAAQQSELASAGIEGPIVPLMLDEIPLLAVVATQARGRTTVSGAAELRVKESDRIEAMAAGLRGLGADVEDAHDGFTVRGPTPLTGSKVDGAGDHRVAMAFAVAGLVAHGETHVEGFECAAVSWPGFENVLVALGAEVELR